MAPEPNPIAQWRHRAPELTQGAVIDRRAEHLDIDLRMRPQRLSQTFEEARKLFQGCKARHHAQREPGTALEARGGPNDAKQRAQPGQRGSHDAIARLVAVPVTEAPRTHGLLQGLRIAAAFEIDRGMQGFGPDVDKAPRSERRGHMMGHRHALMRHLVINRPPIVVERLVRERDDPSAWQQRSQHLARERGMNDDHGPVRYPGWGLAGVGNRQTNARRHRQPLPEPGPRQRDDPGIATAGEQGSREGTGIDLGTTERAGQVDLIDRQLHGGLDRGPDEG